MKKEDAFENVHDSPGEKRVSSRRDFLKGAAAVTAGGIAVMGGMRKVAAQPKEEPKIIYNRLLAFRENCTGCRACEFACTMKHEKIVRPSVSRIYVTRYRDIIDVPNICWQCEDPPCVKACPTKPVAIKMDPKTRAIKYIDDKTCLGAKCNKCVEACPPRYLRRHPDTGWPIFCDMCDGDPECVKACQEQAGDPLGPCLRADTMGFGVNQAFKEVKADQAAKDLMMNLFYPNKDGERR